AWVRGSCALRNHSYSSMTVSPWWVRVTGSRSAIGGVCMVSTLGSRDLIRFGAGECGVVDVEGQHRAGRCVACLEPDRDAAEAGAPHPAVAVMIVPDIHARNPGFGARDRLRGCRCGRLITEEIVLHPVGQSADTDAQKAQSAVQFGLGQ